MPAEVPGSSQILEKAIGGRINLVATHIGRNRSVVERYCRPQPSFDHPHDTGIPNPVDLTVEMGRCVEEPEAIADFICRQFDGKFTRNVPVQHALVVSDVLLEELTDSLAKELRRRKPNLERLRSLRDELNDLTHRLVAEKEKGNDQATSG